MMAYCYPRYQKGQVEPKSIIIVNTILNGTTTILQNFGRLMENVPIVNVMFAYDHEMCSVLKEERKETSPKSPRI